MPQIQVRDITGLGVPDINIRIAFGTQPSDEAVWGSIYTDNMGNTDWPMPFAPSSPYALHLNFADVNPLYVPQSYYVTPNDMSDSVQVILARTPQTRLHVEGHDFYNARGERVFIKGATDFLLYKKYLDGEDIRYLLAERAAFGANCVRVIGMVNSFSHWYPQEYGDRYYDSLPGFLTLLEEYALYCYFTIFADTQIVMPAKQDQINHFNRVVAKLQEADNILIELVNEPYAHSNATDDPFAFPKPAGIIFFGGSYNDQLGNELRPVPPEDAHDYHTPRDGKDNLAESGFKWAADQAVNAHPEFKYRGKPVMSGEPQKFADPNDPRKGGSTLSNPVNARMMAGSARGTACGIFFHTASGVFSTQWNEVERRCAAAWFMELE